MTTTTTREIKYLTQEEVHRFFTKIPTAEKRDRAMFNLMYKYGLRVSEVGLLTMTDVDIDRRRIYIHRLKGGISGEYTLFSDSTRVLKAYLKMREGDFHSALFLSRKKNAISRKRIDVLFKLYAKKARLPRDRWHAHALRHSIAVHMLDAGRIQEDVKGHLGHAHISSTDIYATISSRKKKQIFTSMEQSREIVSM